VPCDTRRRRGSELNELYLYFGTKRRDAASTACSPEDPQKLEQDQPEHDDEIDAEREQGDFTCGWFGCAA